MSKNKNTLELLFESRARVRVLKFLFRNTNSKFTARELAVRTQESLATVKREIRGLLEISLLKVSK